MVHEVGSRFALSGSATLRMRWNRLFSRKDFLVKQNKTSNNTIEPVTGWETAVK